MQQKKLTELEAAPLDEATKAAVDEARAQVRRGKSVTLEQAEINVRKRYKAWQKLQEKNAA